MIDDMRITCLSDDDEAYDPDEEFNYEDEEAGQGNDWSSTDQDDPWETYNPK